MGYRDNVRACFAQHKLCDAKILRKGDVSTRVGNVQSRAKQKFQPHKATFKQHFPDSRAAVFLYKMLQMQAILNERKLEQEISKQVCWYEKN